jgi:MarR family protein
MIPRRQTTVARILAAVQRGFQTSADIADATRIDRTTVSARLNLLAAQGKIVCVGQLPTHPPMNKWKAIFVNDLESDAEKMKRT